MNLLKAASTVSLLTLLSRVTGLVREQLVAAYFGASGATDAFNVAFRIPNLFRRLFAEGAFSQAFVPLLAATRSRDGEEAWAQFSQTGKHFDVVLTDQSMPRLDGVGLARRIRATASPPPVVLMSGHVDEVDAGLLKNLFAAVLHKPVEPGELDRVLLGLPLAEPASVTQY